MNDTGKSAKHAHRSSSNGPNKEVNLGFGYHDKGRRGPGRSHPSEKRGEFVLESSAKDEEEPDGLKQ